MDSIDSGLIRIHLQHRGRPRGMLCNDRLRNRVCMECLTELTDNAGVLDQELPHGQQPAGIGTRRAQPDRFEWAMKLGCQMSVRMVVLLYSGVNAPRNPGMHFSIFLLTGDGELLSRLSRNWNFCCICRRP